MTGNERTAHATTQTFGLALVGAAALVAVVLILALFDGEDVGVFLIVGAVVLAATYITWQFDRQWARAIGIVGTVFSLGMFFFAFGLFHVFSPLEFILGVAYVAGFFISLVAGIRALVAGRKGTTVSEPPLSRFRSSVLVLIGVLAAVSVSGFLVTRESVDDAEAAGSTVLEMVQFEFSPESSTVPVDGKLLIRNSDPFVHDLTLDELDIAVTVGPGSEALVDLTGVVPGTYDYVCSLHTEDGNEADGMVGSFTISG
jgi:plastocyanin